MKGSTPRNWTRIDVAFYAQDTVVELVKRHGPAGPALLLALILSAKQQATSGIPVDQQGAVGLRWAALGRQVGVEVEQVRAVFDTLAELELIEVKDSDGRRVHARLLKWEKWEPRDSGGAARQRGYRGRQSEATVPRRFGTVSE